MDAERAISPHAGRAPLRSALVEGGAVLGVLVFLEAIIFREFFAGSHCPGGDFLGTYNTEAFAWWRDGGFFSPPDWMPYLWGGYPGVLSVQNSSWYLPVGLMSAAVDFDLHASAILSAFHVAFGAGGMYVLARLWGLRPPVAMLGLVTWFFAAGFYANASHLDIMRSYAWMPWVLMVLSLEWPWRRVWATPVAGLILWQAALAMYPGIVVASVYVLATWILLTQVLERPRPREYLVPLAFAAAAAALMTLLRYWPVVLLRGVDSPSPEDSSVLSPHLPGMLMYPYGDPALPGDITMRSFFLPVPAIALAVRAPWGTPRTRKLAGMFLVALLLGFADWPWGGLVRALPGMSLSRFRSSDFKPFLLIALCGAGLLAANDLLRTPSPLRRGAVVGWTLLVGGFYLLGTMGPYSLGGWISQWILLVAAVLVAGRLAWKGARRPELALIGLSVVAGVSGAIAAFSTPFPWRLDRIYMESVGFKMPVRDLIEGRSDAALPRRPARWEPPADLEPKDFLDTKYNGSFYSGELSVLGYGNFKGNATWNRIAQSLLDPVQRPAARAFWSAPGIGIVSDGNRLPEPAEVRECVASGRCGEGVRLTPLSYSRSGSFRYQVEADRASRISFNEAYYAGWQARVRPAAGAWVPAAVDGGSHGELNIPLPAGTSELEFWYSLPGRGTAWVAFGVGVALLAVRALLRAFPRSGRKPVADVTPTG